MLSDKTILVTGASQGIGFEIAKLSSNYGAQVWITGRDKTTLHEVAEQISAQALCYDVTDANAVKAVFHQIKKQAGKLDGLVNNAGIMHDAPIAMTRLDDINAMVQTNLVAPFTHLQLASRLMTKQTSGSIVNMCSIIGEQGAAGQVAYASTKAGLSGMTKAAAKELAPLGIRVNGVAPGFIDTPLTAHYQDKKRDQVINAIGLKRAGTVEDVAQLVCFLLSDKSSYMTGQIVNVDGAMSL